MSVADLWRFWGFVTRNAKGRMIIFKMIDKMLASQKFKDFFTINIASL
jgi:hypothetical protein